jgi:hypothetical protein
VPNCYFFNFWSKIYQLKPDLFATGVKHCEHPCDNLEEESLLGSLALEKKVTKMERKKEMKLRKLEKITNVTKVEVTIQPNSKDEKKISKSLDKNDKRQEKNC